MTTAIDNAMGSAKEAIGSARHAAQYAAEDAAEAVKGTADQAARRAKRIASFLTHIDLDDVLGVIGLRRRQSPFAALALVGGGILVGAGITLLLAPVSGREAREMIRKYFDMISTKAKEEAKDVKQEVKEKVQEKVQEAKEKVGEIVGQVEGEAAQTEDTGDERKGRRRQNQNVQVS